MNRKILLQFMVMYYLGDTDLDLLSMYENYSEKSDLFYESASYCVEYQDLFRKAMALAGFKGLIFDTVFLEIEEILNKPEAWKNLLK